jgi:two-component system, cell cycle sensor histidine kinase and response regulator CckA
MEHMRLHLHHTTLLRWKDRCSLSTIFFKYRVSILVGTLLAAIGTPWFLFMEFQHGMVSDFGMRATFFGLSLLVLGMAITFVLSRNLTQPQYDVTTERELEQQFQQRTAQLEEANRKLELRLQSNTQKRSVAEKERTDALVALHNTEKQLIQSQKLEVVGRLAGGIAHDFNNLLTVILGYSEIANRNLTAGDPLRHNLEEITNASKRAASLTRQLLAFSRKQVMQPRVFDLNTVISELEKMLRRMIGEDVEVHVSRQPNLGRIKADPVQLEQVIMNLVVNARDAMPRGGTLSIETSNVYLDESYAREHVPVVAGDYVMLAISDTGCGMDDETRQHIFEPFFTTKEVGKGTGLGLSMVYGIVRQSGGTIWVYSEAGRGTTFKIYFPMVPADVKDYQHASQPLDPLKGTETILLVEDADLVRTLTRRVLENAGYRVLEAASAEAAIKLCESIHDEKIDLLLTDVVMPGMNADDMCRTLLAKQPGLPVLYMSGYTDDAIVQRGMLEAGVNFLEKPFSPTSLALRVREVLDHRPSAMQRQESASP